MTSPLEREVLEPEYPRTKGPFRSALRRVHLARQDTTPRPIRIALFAWIPLMLGALERLAVDRHPPAILLDISVHVRLLVTIPLLLHAERLVEKRSRVVLKQLYNGHFAPHAALDRFVEQAEKARGSRVVEAALFATALGVGQAALWGLIPPTGVFAGVTHAGELSFSQIWYVTIGLPLMQFLLVRWLWHWGIWSYVVLRLSRIELATMATHPDRAAGIGFLQSPLSSFSIFVLATSSTLAAAWGTQILAGRATAYDFIPGFVVFVGVAYVLACGPLLAFLGPLYRARYRETAEYNRLSLDFVRGFHAKWIGGQNSGASTGADMIGVQDPSSMIDLLDTYKSMVSLRLVPFGPRSALGIWACAALPMLPIVATTMPIHELVLKIGKTLLGGIA